MAAPSTAYLTQKFNTITSTSTLVQHNLAIPTDAISTLKSRFYLDEIFQTQTGSGTGFIGGCVVGSVNYNHHNTSRIGSLRSRNSTGDVVYYVDSGLNSTGNVDSLNVVIDSNGINATANFTSSYYEVSPKTGLITTHFNSSNNSGGFVTVQPRASASTTRRLKYTFQKGDTFTIDAQIEGDEGTFTSPTQSIYVTRSDCFKIRANIITASGANPPTGSILFAATNGILDPTYHSSSRIEWTANGTPVVPIDIYIENSAANGGNSLGTVPLQITGAFYNGTWVLLGTNYGDTYTFDSNLELYIKLTNY